MSRVLLYTLATLVFFLSPAVASAATFEIWPERSSFRAGETVQVRILVESDQAFNAVDGRITFPAQLLSVVSVSKQNSVVSLWVQEPVYSNVAGTLDFSGVVPNPGYSGPQRRVITVTFRAKQEGSAQLEFASASVLANDGQGTELLTQARGTTLSIGAGEAPVVPSPEEVPALEVPLYPFEPAQPAVAEEPAFSISNVRAFLFETSVPLVYFAGYVLLSIVALLGFFSYYVWGLRIKVYRVKPVAKSGRSRQTVEE